jgi:hypothetical protein
MAARIARRPPRGPTGRPGASRVPRIRARSDTSGVQSDCPRTGSRDPTRAGGRHRNPRRRALGRRTRFEHTLRRAGPQDLRCGARRHRPTSLRSHRRCRSTGGRSPRRPDPKTRWRATPRRAVPRGTAPRLPWWGGCRRSRQRPSACRFPHRAQLRHREDDGSAGRLQGVSPPTSP